IVNHLIAQTDVQYSNSMIEAANKQLKYRFLYHHKISDFSKLEDYLKKAIHDFNNRPHGVLNGLTPIEVLEGKTFNQESLNNLVSLAKQIRIKENQQMNCCGGSF
ncbi:MAG TPA: integrase core domain-containing protein, partial [Ginsengibacter sp.]